MTAIQIAAGHGDLTLVRALFEVADVDLRAVCRIGKVPFVMPGDATREARREGFSARLQLAQAHAIAAQAMTTAIDAIAGRYLSIPAGTYEMGSPLREAGRSSRDESLPVSHTCGPFYMKQTPVTQGEWRRVMGYNPSAFAEDGPDDERADDRPVEMVSWFDAVVYCNRLSDLAGLQTCYDLSAMTNTRNGEAPQVARVHAGRDGFRLPTSVEWEYAARAGDASATYGCLADIAWTTSNAGGRTHPVGRKRANAWGAHDTLGNVSEWTSDTRWATNVRGFSAEEHLVRGGHFQSSHEQTRAAAVASVDPTARSPWCGFRPVRSRD